jgi:hypothetical protein
MDDQTVVITGGTRGIGRAVAEQFADVGKQVVICGRETARVDETVDELNGEHAGDEPNVSGVRADVRDEYEIERLMEHAARRGGEIDVVIANAAVNHGTPGEMPTHEESYSRFDDSMRTNARGVFATIKEAVPHLASEARILVPSGGVARKAKAGMGAYAISKAGAEAVARGFAVDVDQPVSVIDPGLVATDLTGIEKARDPADIAPMYLWAATEADPEAIDGEIVDLKTWKQSTR